MKLNITLDVSKINKDKIVTRTYLNKDGVEVTEKNYKMEAVPLNEKKMVTEGDTWIMYKTHFIVEGQSKEEKQQKVKGTYIGSGFQFEEKGGTNTEQENAQIRALKEKEFASYNKPKSEDIPF
jgi:hypothetical protein